MQRGRTYRACPYCQSAISASNFARHIHGAHQNRGLPVTSDQITPPLGTLDRSLANRPTGVLTVHRQAPVSEDSTRDGDPVQDDLVVLDKRTIYASAAVNLLDQHRHLYEPDLEKFLSERHPEIPREHQFPLLIGAMAGAQFAAQLHLFSEANRGTDDGWRQRAARNAHAALIDWNFGLRIGTRTAMPVFHERDSIVGPWSLPTVVEAASALPPPGPLQPTGSRVMEFNFPVDLQRSNRDFAAETSSTEGERMVIAESPPSQQQEASSEALATIAPGGLSSAPTTSVVPYTPEATVPAVSTLAYHPTPLPQLRAQQPLASATQLTVVTSGIRNPNPVSTSLNVSEGVQQPPRSPRMSTTDRFRVLTTRVSPTSQRGGRAEHRHRSPVHRDRRRDHDGSHDRHDRQRSGSRR